MLLNPAPLWRVELAPGETGGIQGHARLLGERVAGCWFALERSSGRRLWSRRRARANDLFAATAEVLIGTRIEAQDPTAIAQGVYGICAATGDLLWSHLSRSPKGRLARWWSGRDVPDDGPLSVQGGRVYTRLKLALDARTGRRLERDVTAPQEPPGPADEELSSELFFLRIAPLPGTSLRLLRRFDPKDPLEHLKHERCAHPDPVPMNYGAIDAQGHLVWERRCERAATHWHGSRVLGGRIVMLEPAGPGWRLSVLDGATGALEQELELAEPASIQDADERGLLLGLGSEVSRSIRALAYYERAGVTSSSS